MLNVRTPFLLILLASLTGSHLLSYSSLSHSSGPSGSPPSRASASSSTKPQQKRRTCSALSWPSNIPPRAHVLPLELDVIHARVKYWAGDAHGYTDALGALLRRCRRRAQSARLDADRQMWIERGARVGLIATSHFIEIKVSPLSSLFPPLFSFPIL